MKIGLYFGSFNPVHIGHLIISNHVLNETDIQKIWFIISPQNPFKPSSTLLNEYDRLYLVQKATENDERLKVSDIEFFLPKPSYTSHTLAYLAEKHPSHQFTIIMGSDSFQNLENWKNVQAIVDNYPIVVYNRSLFDTKKNSLSAKVSFLNAPFLDISATYIRQCIQKGASIKYLVPEAVEKEIERSSFYKKIHVK